MKINPRILGASVAGLLLVVISFVFSPTSHEDHTATAYQNQETTYRGFIREEDKNGDRIPDWQEAFATFEIDLDDVSTTTEFTPKTMTDKFAVDLVDSANDPYRTVTTNEFVERRLNQLVVENLNSVFTVEDIKVGVSDNINTWRNYGNEIAMIAFSYPLGKDAKNEMDTLSKALKKNDPDVLTDLKPNLQAYKGMLEEMKTVSVPPSLTEEHLSLMNAYQALAINIETFSQVFDDTLPTVMRMARYYQDVASLQNSISNLYTKLYEAGIRWTANDPANNFIRIEI